MIIFILQLALILINPHSPIFDKAEIKVAGGTFTIRTEDNSDSNRYIQSITLNGAPYNKGYICHEDIAAGGELVIKMGSEPRTMIQTER